MKNEIHSKEAAEPSFGYKTINATGICDDRPFKFYRMPENIPGNPLSDEDIFAAVRHSRAQTALLERCF